MKHAIDIASVENKHETLKERFFDVLQGRSDYQLAQFVVGPHASPERQYCQCVQEIQNKYYAIKRADINRRKIRAALTNVKCPFEKEEKELDLEQIEIALVGAIREFNTLYSLMQQYPAFTNAQIQEAEEAYWVKRLATQAQQDIEAHGSISTGNAEALRQAGVIDGYVGRFFKSAKDHPGLTAKRALGQGDE